MRYDYPGIYRIDGPNGCVYIGSASNIYFRFKHHQNYLAKNQHKNEHLQRAWNKYEPGAFTFSVIERVDNKAELLHYEQIWLDILFDSLEPDLVYNKCRIAGTRAGIAHSQAHKDKIRASLIGHKHSQETIDKIKENRPKDFTPRARIHNIVLVSPSGTEYTSIFNLAAFRREHRLDKHCLSNLIKGKTTQYKGWRLRRNQE